MIAEKTLSSPIRNAYLESIGKHAAKAGLDWDSMTTEERFSFADSWQRMKSEENKQIQERIREKEELMRNQERQSRINQETMHLEAKMPRKYLNARISDFSAENPVIAHILGGGSCLFTGCPGIGKTHLIWAIARYLVENGERADEITVINLQDLVCDIKENGQSNWARFTKREYGKQRHLFIDEFDKTYGSLSDYTIISDLISYRYDNLLPTVIAGNGGTDTALMILGAAAFSRLTGKSDGGAYFPLKGEDRRR